MITTYNEEDIFLITIGVLQICVTNFLCNSFKVIVDRQYQDLIGMVPTDELDNESLELINNVEAKWWLITSDCIEALSTTCSSLANLYGIRDEEIVGNKRILDLALHFASHLIIDDFPHGDDEIEPDEDYDDHLRQFSMSLIAVVHFLCTLITNKGAINFNESWDHILELDNADFSEEEHFVALNRLKNCWKVVVKSFDALEEELDYKNKLNLYI